MAEKDDPITKDRYRFNGSNAIVRDQQQFYDALNGSAIPQSSSLNPNKRRCASNTAIQNHGAFSQVPSQFLERPQSASTRHILQPRLNPQAYQTSDGPRRLEDPSSANKTSHNSCMNSYPKMGAGLPSFGPQTLDTGKLLMSMAEEYFEAAENLVKSGQILTDNHVEYYQKLIATGLGCLEAALKRISGLDPKDEARIRLRFASVLFEKTENSMEAETTLSKGIELCERNHYYDLKYAMYFILAQCVAKSNLKAAIKTLDTNISEAETFTNTSWVYAFRFLRASYSLACGTHLDNNAAVRNLRAIAALATQHGDRPIHLVASLMEAIAHLRTSGVEANQNLKSAMASVWSHQMDDSCRITSLTCLAYSLDLACSIREGDSQDMMTKLQAARLSMDTSMRNRDWSGSDILLIPIRRTQNSTFAVSHNTKIILDIGNDGNDNLVMRLFDQRDAYCISCLLYGIVLLQKNASERIPAYKYLNQGLSLLEKDDEYSSTKGISNILLSNSTSKFQWRINIVCYTRIYLAFCHALNSEWAEVKAQIEGLKKAVENLETPLSRHLESLLIYLNGIFYQGSGDLDAALKIFKDQRFNIVKEKSQNISFAEQLEFDIAILANLNALLILQHPNRVDPVRNTTMLNKLEPVCAKHPNLDIVNAFNLIMVTVKTDPSKTVMEVKHHLSAALNGTKKKNNSQLLSMTVTLMFSFFFVGVLGTQAENAAQAASRTAAKSANPLWMSVADGMLARCYEIHGKLEEAQKTMALALKSAEKIGINP